MFCTFMASMICDTLRKYETAVIEILLAPPGKDTMVALVGHNEEAADLIFRWDDKRLHALLAFAK